MSCITQKNCWTCVFQINCLWFCVQGTYIVVCCIVRSKWTIILFQQDVATFHLNNETVSMLDFFFSDWLNSKNLWPPKSPDLSIPGFFLWGYLQDKVFEGNSQTTDDLKIAIPQRIQKVTPSMFKNFSENVQTSSTLSSTKG